MSNQLTISFEIHHRENNPVSQAHLEANKHLFSDSCFEVLKVLVAGEVLTTDNAKEKAGTRSLPRRIKDLRDNMGISISEEWVFLNGRKSHMKWFMTAEDKISTLNVLMNRLKKAA